MNDEETYQYLLDAAFRFVSYRPRSKSEIYSFLKKKTDKRKIDPEVMGRVMVRLTELGYCDDFKFAQYWLQSRSHRNFKGQKVLQLELKQKGVDKHIIDRLISSEVDELNLAKKAAIKPFARILKLPRLEQKKKLYAYLGRRGFTSETIRRVIDELVKKDYNKDYIEGESPIE